MKYIFIVNTFQQVLIFDFELLKIIVQLRKRQSRSQSPLKLVYSVLYNQSQHYILALIRRATKQESESEGMTVRFFMSLKILKMVEPVIFFNTKFHLLTWKIWFRPKQRIFRENNGQIPQVWEKKIPKFQIFMISSVKLSDGYHQVFGYITELKKHWAGQSMASTSFSHNNTLINASKILSFNQLLQSLCTQFYFENFVLILEVQFQRQNETTTLLD